MRHTTTITAILVGLFAAGSLAAEEKPAAKPEQAKTANTVESAVAVGTVTALDEKHHSFTFRADGGDEALEYRAWLKMADGKEIAKQIQALKVGDRRKITYTEHEGRRALKIEDAPAANAK